MKLGDYSDLKLYLKFGVVGISWFLFGANEDELIKNINELMYPPAIEQRVPYKNGIVEKNRFDVDFDKGGKKHRLSAEGYYRDGFPQPYTIFFYDRESKGSYPERAFRSSRNDGSYDMRGTRKDSSCYKCHVLAEKRRNINKKFLT